MKKVVLGIIMMFCVLGGYAQSEYSFGIDEQRDSIKFAQMRVKMDSIREHRPTIALVMSGGGAKGAAHVRVLQYLEQIDIPIDMVLGTSIGGLVGGLYSCGYTGAEIEGLFSYMDWDEILADEHPREYLSYEPKLFKDKFLFDLPIDSTLHSQKFPTGMVYGQNVTNLLASLLVGYEDDMDFFNLPIPFVCIGADLVTAKPKVWYSGKLITAMRSTMSIPVMFAPVRTEGMVLIDGGMMDNYPVGIAKEMGADIVIGIDISAPAVGYDEINNVVDIVMQILDIRGRETYLHNQKLVDVSIKPDIFDFNMLSFTEESIATMILKGDTAAKESTTDLMLVKDLVGDDSLHYQCARAINLHDSTVSISDIEIVGVNDHEKDYLMHLYDVKSLKNNKIVNFEDINKAVAAIYGTNAFQSVIFQMLGTQAPYRLQFLCKKGSPHQFGFGARFDTEELTSVLFRFGFNANKLEGHAFNIIGRLGMNSMLDAHYFYKTSAKVDVNAAVSIRNVMRNRFAIDKYKFELNYFNFRSEAFLSVSQWTNASFKAGAMIDYYNADSPLTDYQWDESLSFVGDKNSYLSLFAKLGGDTFDDIYFPHRGTAYTVSYAWYLAGLINPIEPFHAVQGHFRTVALDKGNWSLLPYIDARFLLGDSIALPFRNSVCVSIPGRDIEQQIPFIGLNEARPQYDLLAIIGIDLRYQFLKNHYITARANLAHTSPKFSQFFDFDTAITSFGFALEYAFDSFLGPLKVDIHWNSLSKSPGAYLSLGFDF